LLTNVTADCTIRLLPPLILSDEDALRLTGLVAAAVNAFTQQNNH
jgi:acetylornithine/succinyldiaminopimelate/putrescine aminotransferase